MAARNKSPRRLPPQTDIIGTYGYWLAHERIRQNLSQEQLAERAGVKRETVCRAESGEHDITLQTACKLAEGLELPLQALLPVNKDDIAACIPMVRMMFDLALKIICSGHKRR